MQTALSGKSGKSYFLLLTDSRGCGYDTVMVCRSRDGADKVAVLHSGEWSGWLEEAFGRENLLHPDVAPGVDPVHCTFRMKLLELTPDADFLAIQIHTQDAINHVIAREITPGCKEYNPAYWEHFRRNYHLTDRMIGGLVSA